MIVILKNNHNREQLESLINWLQEKGISIHTRTSAGYRSPTKTPTGSSTRRTR